MTRQECNIEILDNLYDYIICNPRINFGEALLNTAILASDMYDLKFLNTESSTLLERMVAPVVK